MLDKSNFHNYQHKALQHVIDQPFSGLLMEMGLGKTIVTLSAIQYLMYEEFEINKVLVVAPKRVAENVWTSEIKEWAHIKGLRTSRIIGTAAQRKMALAEDADIYLLGRDNVVWLIGQYGGSMLPFDMLVLDESSSFKNPKSQRFKALRRVLASFKRIVLLTGTPAPNGLMDLWSQIFILDRGERLGKFIGKYRSEYFIPGRRSGHIVYNYKLQKDGERRIHDKISDICLSMKAEDYLDLPGVTFNDIDIKFPPKLQKQYDEFERDQVMQLLEEDAEISAMSAAALSNKLLQFANGAVYDEDRVVHEVHRLKLDEVADIVESAAGKPVLIAYIYKHDFTRLMEKLKKYDPVHIGKGEQNIIDWNAGRIRVMLMHPASGGHGLNLQKGGNTIVWFGQTWSLELYQQLNARLNRQGQTNRVIIHRLIASKTVEQDVLRALERKDETQEGLMQAIKLRIEKYGTN